jgi:type IV pilus assembly protein PilM
MFFKSHALGLEIFQNGFSWVLASGTTANPRIERFETVNFAEDILKPSIKEQNLLDSTALGKSLKESYKKLLTSENRVSLSIPEFAGRVTLLDMDTPFKNKEEGVDQIKWKLKRSFPFDMNEIHLDYQILKETGTGGITLLVALVARNIINEYEEILLVNGFEPSKIDFAIFNLYRLFAAKLEIEDNLALIINYRGNLAVMIFQDGVIDFFRGKQLNTALNDPVRLYREVNSSMLVYSDMKEGWKPQKIYYYTSPHARALFRSVISEVTGSEPILIDTEPFIGNSRQKLDRSVLSGLLSAFGAAARGLG